MKKNNTPLVVGAVIVLVLVIFIGFLFSQDEQGRRFNWYQSYSPRSDQPYGAKVLRQLLDSDPNHEFSIQRKSMVDWMRSDDFEQPSNYIWMGANLELYDYSEIDTLFKFVEAGNRAFLLVESLPRDIAYDLGFFECLNWDNYSAELDSAVVMNMTHPDQNADTGYAFHFVSRYDTLNYNWMYLDPNQLCAETDVQVNLGYFNGDKINYFRVPYGEGFFYFYTTPLALTNYHLIKRRNFEYAQKVFAHLGEGPVYWDQYSPTSRDNSSLDERGRQRFSGQTPLQFLLGEPPLKWGLYLLVAVGLLFLLFRSKRLQRIIPVREGNVNTSLEFIKTIGRIYFLQNNNKKLAHQKMKLFLGFIRNRYNIRTRDLDVQLVKAIVVRSQVPHIEVQAIFDQYEEAMELTHVENNRLINFHLVINEFYKKCK